MKDEIADGLSACCAGRPRRTVLRAGLIAPIGAGLGLAACGSQDVASSSSQTASEDADTTSGSPSPDGLVLAASDVPVGGSTYFPDANVVVAQPVDGEFVAFDATCPHQGCSVSGASGTELVCPCHESSFDQSTGAVVSGPATTGLTSKSVSLEGEDLVLQEGR